MCHGRPSGQAPEDGSGRPPTTLQWQPQSRGWPAFAGHDTSESASTRDAMSRRDYRVAARGLAPRRLRRRLARAASLRRPLAGAERNPSGIGTMCRPEWRPTIPVRQRRSFHCGCCAATCGRARPGSTRPRPPSDAPQRARRQTGGRLNRAMLAPALRTRTRTAEPSGATTSGASSVCSVAKVMCGSLVLAGIAGSFRPTDAAATPNPVPAWFCCRTDQPNRLDDAPPDLCVLYQPAERVAHVSWPGLARPPTAFAVATAKSWVAGRSLSSGA